MTSIIIPTLNAERLMPGLLKALKSQTSACEIVVVDSSSSDDTVRIAESHGVKVLSIKRHEFDHGGTRNLGVNASSGDILIFLTQDALPVDEYMVENLIRPLQDPGIALSYGRQIAEDDSTPLERFARTFNYPEKPIIKGKEDIPLYGIKTFFCSNVCSSVRRKDFREIGGFPENIIMNEDMILAAKFILKGCRVAYEPSAAVYHSHNYSIIEQFRRYFDIGVSLGRNRWILESAKMEGEGIRYLKEQTTYLLRSGKLCWIPYSYIEGLAKYSALRLGFLENGLPSSLKLRLSMHRHFWKA